MILPMHRRLRSGIIRAAAQAYGLEPSRLPSIVIEYPPSRTLGDLAVPLAFELARTLRKAPRIIAQGLVEALEPIDGVRAAAAAPNGYINVHLDRAPFLTARLAPQEGGPPKDAAASKTIVEHTAINPNKAAHIGHLRNAALGDTLVRLLRFQGAPVEVQNYIDDTGVQVADVVLGFRRLESRDLAGVREVAETTRFDHYCWDLYARVTDWYEGAPERLEARAATLHDIEQGGNEAAKMARFIAEHIVGCHLQTMARMNVGYDLLAWEGDILRLQFWATAFEILRESGAVFQQTEGKLAGCWVMRIEDLDETSPPPGASAPKTADDAAAADEGREKVIVRSDGTVTYVGKDIAYQFWKFGLLGRDFRYRRLGDGLDERPLWSTCTEPPPDGTQTTPPAFGGATRTYNVIDTRQSYLQKLLQQALATMGHVEEARQSIHFSYEMVALSHATARELGVESADPSRPFVEVSGRKGLGVKADDLLDRLSDKARDEIAKRNPDLAPEATTRMAGMIATAAVRYFMIKYSRGKLITFDIDEALSFEGETGPYLQYALVRANNIFEKLRARTGLTEADIIRALPATPADTLQADLEGGDLWNLVLESARLDEVVEQAVRTLELSSLAKHAFALAQSFNAIYHRYPILNAERTDIQYWRAATVVYFRAQLTRAVTLMGFEVPSRM